MITVYNKTFVLLIISTTHIKTMIEFINRTMWFINMKYLFFYIMETYFGANSIMYVFIGYFYLLQNTVLGSHQAQIVTPCYGPLLGIIRTQRPKTIEFV